MPKALVVLCWVWIGIWLGYKVIQISKGYMLDALDFTNPSLAGIIAVVCIVSLIINSTMKKSEITTSPKNVDKLDSVEVETYTCSDCEAEVSVDDSVCPNCGAQLDEVEAVEENEEEEYEC